mgnify:CR=1 FL=1
MNDILPQRFLGALLLGDVFDCQEQDPNVISRDPRADTPPPDLAARPEPRIVALSTIAGGDEFNGVIRVVAVIEYL